MTARLVGELTSHPLNPREGDVGVIAQSLELNGQYRPIVVQVGTDLVIAGNHTLAAARALGWESIECVELDVSDLEAVEILAIDNRSSDRAWYDPDALLAQLQSMKDLRGTGFEMADVGELLDSLTKPGLTKAPQAAFPPAVGVLVVVGPWSFSIEREAHAAWLEVHGAAGPALVSLLGLEPGSIVDSP